MGTKNEIYNQYLKTRSRYRDKQDLTFEDYQRQARPINSRVKLGKDYSNLWEMAGDYYGDQRFYNELKRANPGVTRFSRGQYINLPRFGEGYVPYLSHSQVARERGQFDYSTYQPTADYWNEVEANRQASNGGISEAQGTAPTMPGQAPEGFTLRDIGYARKFGNANAPENAFRYTPQVQEKQYVNDLRREEYQYFYGPQDENRPRTDAERMAARQAALDAATRQNVEYIPSQFTRGRAGAARREVPQTHQLQRGGQYGVGRYGNPESIFDNKPPTAVERAFTSLRRGLALDDLYQTLKPVPGEAFRGFVDAFGIDKIGRSVNETLGIRPQEFDPFADMGTGGVHGSGPNKGPRVPNYNTVSGRLANIQQTQSPYTTDWLDNWMANYINADGDIDLSGLDDQTYYMLQVVNAIEPTEFATTYGSGGYSGYGGGGYSYYGGGGGGGRGGYPGYGGGGYSYPYQSYDNGGYASYMGLVNWKI